MSGIESLVTQVHRGETVPGQNSGAIPPPANQKQSQQQQPQKAQQQAPQQQQQQSPQEEASCWSRIFCCRATPTNDDHHTESAIPSSQQQQQSTPSQQQQQSTPSQQQTPQKNLSVNTNATSKDQRTALQSPRVEKNGVDHDDNNNNKPQQEQQQQHPQSSGLKLTSAPTLDGHTNGYTRFIHRNYNPSTNEYDIGEGYQHYLLPPLPPYHKHKKTLVLDLDETLVHSSFKPINDADFQIQIELDGVYHQVYVRKRPFVDEFLLHVAKNWEVVIFTASLAKYADPLLDILDPHRVITSRLFRESCVHHYKTYYVKDLRILGRPLSDSTIIDNSQFSYMFQPEQGLPIISWYDEPEDTQLRDLLPFLDHLADCKDMVAAMQASQPLFVDGGIAVPYQLPDIEMLPPEERWTAQDEINLNKLIENGWDEQGNNGDYQQQMMLTLDGNDQFQQNGTIDIPQTPQVNRSGRSALNSPVAGKRELNQRY